MELSNKMPCDTEAEKTILGAILSGHPQTAELFEMLEPGDFDDSRHQVIFATLRSLWDATQPVELPALADSLNSSKQTEMAGGISYVASVAEPVPSRVRSDRYATNVRKKRVLRDFIKACNEWSEISFKNPDIGEVLDRAKERISELSLLAAAQENGKSFRDASTNLIATLKEPQKSGLHTGLPEVDDRTGGFRAGELGIITAETGVGKTFFALQIARKSCSQGRHLLYCSGEMLAEHLMGRVLSAQSHVDYSKIRRPATILEAEYFQLIDLAVKQCPDCRVIDGELSLPRIRMAARSMPVEKFGGLIVDYDELVEVRGKDEWEQQRILVRSLKSLAMELKVPVVVVSQLRKALNPEERKHPTLQRLYGSGAKAKHASIVLYVDRPFVQELCGDETEAKIFILKCRDGRMGQTECTFNIRTLSFEEGAPQSLLKHFLRSGAPGAK